MKCRSELRTESWLRKSGLHLILGGGPNQWDRDQFYPLLTKLTQNWEQMEEHLWKQRSSVPRLYLYDITSTYFEGKGGLFAALGYVITSYSIHYTKLYDPILIGDQCKHQLRIR